MMTRTTAERFAPRHGYANRLLRIDLSSHEIRVQPMDGLAPDYIGGRGVAARIAWNEYPEPVSPFAPENPLVIMTGALTGTRSPFSGRTSITTFSPQAYPLNWFTRTNIGAQWGAELKQAGYDGLVVTGASDTPVQIVIIDDEVKIVPADDLWGLDTYETQDEVAKGLGKKARTLTIGPAGERLSRIATVHTATSSTAGQSGAGAVMGAKKLKAISVIGTGRPSIAHPDAFNTFVKDLSRELRAQNRVRNTDKLNKDLACQRGGRARPYACTAACPTPCNLYYSDMPGVAFPERRWEGHWTCIGGALAGIAEGGPVPRGRLFDWKLGSYGGLEMNVLSNRYGINQWDLLMSLVPWLERCQRDGLLDDINGTKMDWESADFWASFLHALAYREGIGDVLAEGGLRAAMALDMGLDSAMRHYTAWGYGGHWDGHGDLLNHLVFPYWVVSVLQWATDTRDPYSSSHGYVQNIMWHSPIAREELGDKDITWEQMFAISERLYGSPAAVDPTSGYQAKAFPAFYHDRRSVMKDSLPSDDQTFPLIYSRSSEDGYFRVGDVEGPSVDHRLFVLGTGTEWSESDFDAAADRIYTLERALCVRHWGRDRTMDETVFPAFEYPENSPSPALESRQTLDVEKLRPVMDEYYGHLGWDPLTGWPTPERLQSLGLADVYTPMVTGAERARQNAPDWPELPRAKPF